MAGSVNKVILVGNLGKDPEIRRTQDGRPIANLSVATSESWRDKATGERKEKTEWHRVVIFNEGALQGRRAISEEGRQGVHRGRVADPQMDRSGRRREVLDRSRAAGLQLDADHARRPRRRGGGGGFADEPGGDFGAGSPSSAPPRRAVRPERARATATWTTTFRSERSTERATGTRARSRLFVVRALLIVSECARCIRALALRTPDLQLMFGLRVLGR